MSFLWRHFSLWWIRNVVAAVCPRRFTHQYVKYLTKLGVKFNGLPDNIDRSAYFDPSDFSLYKLGNNVVISKDVLLLTHDYSITNAFRCVGEPYWKDNDAAHFLEGIEIGDNSFIGARAVILPGTTIGKNVIIGACAVVKGHIEDNSVIVGNPGRRISSTEEYAKKHINNGAIINH